MTKFSTSSETTTSGTGAAAYARPLLEHALLLIARQHGGDAATAHAAAQALGRWRTTTAAHEAAAQAAQRAWAATDARELQGCIPLPRTQAERSRQARRRMLLVLGLGGLAASVGSGLRWYWQCPLQELALHTGHGQLLQRTLDDGSRLDLAPRTQMQVVLFRDRREVHLRQGEARFEVAPDTQRPFSVVTAAGRVRVLGTAFTVSLQGDRMAVAVAHGRVAVWAAPDTAPADQPPATELIAGQTVQAQGGRLDEVGHVDEGDVAAWRQGWLVFDRTPLPEAVARWNDYLAHPLALADEPGLQALRLTGSFPLRDPAAFVASLPAILAVQVERTPNVPESHRIRLRR